MRTPRRGSRIQWPGRSFRETKQVYLTYLGTPTPTPVFSPVFSVHPPSALLQSHLCVESTLQTPSLRAISTFDQLHFFLAYPPVPVVAAPRPPPRIFHVRPSVYPLIFPVRHVRFPLCSSTPTFPSFRPLARRFSAESIRAVTSASARSTSSLTVVDVLTLEPPCASRGDSVLLVRSYRCLRGIEQSR